MNETMKEIVFVSFAVGIFAGIRILLEIAWEKYPRFMRATLELIVITLCTAAAVALGVYLFLQQHPSK